MCEVCEIGERGQQAVMGIAACHDSGSAYSQAQALLSQLFINSFLNSCFAASFSQTLRAYLGSESTCFSCLVLSVFPSLCLCLLGNSIGSANFSLLLTCLLAVALAVLVFHNAGPACLLLALALCVFLCSGPACLSLALGVRVPLHTDCACFPHL